MRRVMGVLLAAVAIAACTGKYIRPTTDEKVPLTPDRVERGRYLVESVAACGSCHDGHPGGKMEEPTTPELKLAGGGTLRDGEMAVWVPNLTPDRETGLGAWSDDEIIRAIRDGIGRDGKVLFPLMPYEAYQHLSDDDVRAVVAYLRSVPAVKQTVQRTETKSPFMISMGMALGIVLHEPAKNVAAPAPSDPVAYGGYLTMIGHCAVCHSLGKTGMRKPDDRWLGGADVPMEPPGVGKVWASNLTPSKTAGLGNFSALQIKTAIVEGKCLHGDKMAPPMADIVPYVKTMKSEDLDAIVAYLQSVKPVDKPVPERQLTAEAAKKYE